MAGSLRHALDSLQHVIAVKDSLFGVAATRTVTINGPHESLVIRVLPSLLGAVVGGSMAVFGAMKAQEHRARIEDRRTYRQIKHVLTDEVSTLAMRCGHWATFMRQKVELSEFHIYQIQVRIEVNRTGIPGGSIC